jgi:hypothetical protein
LEGGVPIHDDDPCVAADVAERLVVRTWHDVTTVAAHQPELIRSRSEDMVFRRRRGVVSP